MGDGRRDPSRTLALMDDSDAPVAARAPFTAPVHGPQGDVPTPTPAAVAPTGGAMPTPPSLVTAPSPVTAPFRPEVVAADFEGVEVALERLDAGTYWSCEVTGAELPDELLAANPVARRLPGDRPPAERPAFLPPAPRDLPGS